MCNINFKLFSCITLISFCTTLPVMDPPVGGEPLDQIVEVIRQSIAEGDVTSSAYQQWALALQTVLLAEFNTISL